MTSTVSFDDLLRPELRGQLPYGAPQMDVPVRLNVNENPYPPPDSVRQDMVEALRIAAQTLNRYPDREAWELRSKLATYLGYDLEPTQVWAANGSNEIMVQLLSAFAGPGRRMISFEPSYSMYIEYARNTYTDFITISRTSDYRIDKQTACDAISMHHPDVIVIASPNNPTGTVTDLKTIEAILGVASGIVVVDEAYQEFSCAPSALELLPEYENLVVTRTMSKAFAFAGGRVGYLCGCEGIVNALRIVRLPYHLSQITQAVAGAALDHADEMLAQVGSLRRTRDRVMAHMRAMGLTVVDSQANFFLFGPFTPDRHIIWQKLVDQGVLVRETGPEPYLRTCIGTDEEMDRFLCVLAEILPAERNMS